MNSKFRFVLSFLLGCGGALAAAAESPEDIVPLKIIQTADPMFPPSLERAGVRHGIVHAAIKVGADGKLEDLLITAYTRKEFADAAITAIEKWRFEPASDNGVPLDSVRDLVFNFELLGVTMDAPSLLDQGHVSRLKISFDSDDSFDYQACELRDLDRIPVLRHVVVPAGYPPRSSGSVTVEFYIDEQGRVRLPGVSGDADAPFANAALDAVRQWQFDPPTSRGNPVLVRASQTFHFTPASAQSGFNQ
jgi:TonB family protein